MSRKKEKIPTDGRAESLGQNPFAKGLEGLHSPSGPREPPSGESLAGKSKSSRKEKPGPAPRLELRRETKGRGGKAVIVISGFPGSVHPSGRKALLKHLQMACATGGSLKGDTLEIQGDHRDQLEQILKEAGFRTVRTGG